MSSTKQPLQLLQPLQKFEPFAFHKLDEFETFWMEHQQWLEEKGYMLRPRYRPGWVPSWDINDEDVWPYDVEDAIPCHVRCFSSIISENKIHVV